MVKAYFRYVEQDVVGGLTGTQSNIELCILTDEIGEQATIFIVSACNEVVNFTNIKTSEVQYKIFDKEALYGQVTFIKSSSSSLAIGFSSGTIQIFSLTMIED